GAARVRDRPGRRAGGAGGGRGRARAAGGRGRAGRAAREPALRVAAGGAARGRRTAFPLGLHKVTGVTVAPPRRAGRGRRMVAAVRPDIPPAVRTLQIGGVLNALGNGLVTPFL